GVAAGVRLWPDAERVVSGFGKSPLMAVISVKLLFLLTVGAHQLVHGLALIHYGRRVREFGFTFLHGFVPTFYVDVTDTFMVGRAALTGGRVASAGWRLRGRASLRFTRQEALFAGYVLVSTVSVLAFIPFNVWLVVHAS